MNKRIEKLFTRLSRDSAYFISSASDVFYLTGFTGTFGKIIIRNKKAYFITDLRYAGAVAGLKLPAVFETVITKNFHVSLKKIFSGIRTLGLNRNSSLSEYLFLKTLKKRLEFRADVEALRMIKDMEEVRLIKKSVEITESGIRHILSRLKTGVSEKDLSIEFDFHTRKLGADGPSFPPIIAFGSNSAVPHHASSDAMLCKGDFILIDAGVKYRGYCSDLTRGACFGIIINHLRNVQKHYNIVRNAKAAGVLSYIKGQALRMADFKTRQYLEKNGGFERLFTHSLGHGIGLDIHEPPFVNSREKTNFSSGMVLSCEPGIYFNGRYGIRIEDDYLITGTGPERLGKMNDELIIKE